ncbi:protein kinase domain-containing protein [Sorangium sp. So ce233]|uniref:protein kinase domain-containing protein n=1 Tax=Sorangium sp. So ce233 TaxID=3133290 RepID=UPI003F61841C
MQQHPAVPSGVPVPGDVLAGKYRIERKPKNLFLTRRPDGTPLLKVLDFGLSKFIATGDSVKEASLTATGLIMGSIHYMSPEQIRSLKYADVRTDIWPSA